MRVLVALLFLYCSNCFAIDTSLQYFFENSEECRIQSDCRLFEVTPIEKEYIRSFDGKVFKKQTFTSPLQEYLTLHLQDRTKAEHIWKSYQSMKDKLEENPELHKYFQSWLSDHLFFLGCKKRCMQLVEKDPILSHHTVLLEGFFDQISCKEHSHTPQTNHKIKRILLLTTSCGGGEMMVAKAIEKQLLLADYEVFFLDTKEIEQETDIFYKYSGMRHEDIYSLVFQKENNRRLAYKLTNLAVALRPFIENERNARLKEHIKKILPDLIFTTRYNYPSDVSFAYDLNIPIRFIHCDYRFSPELYNIAKESDPSLVKFWVPSDYHECLAKTVVPTEMIEILGYPVRFGIKKENDPAVVAAIRKKYHIPHNKKVVTMMMGLQGVGDIMLSLLQEIFASSSRLGPLHIQIICGYNQPMQESMQNFLKSVKIPAHISVRVLGKLDEYELADCYNISDAFISKAGGATISELITMKVPALVFTTSIWEGVQTYEWEEPNIRYLTACGCGIELKRPEDFIDTLLTLLHQEQNINMPSPVNWQKQIITLLQSSTAQCTEE